MTFSEVSRRAALAALAAATTPRLLLAAAAPTDQLPEVGKTGDIRVCLSDDPFEGSVVITTAFETTLHELGKAKSQLTSAARSDVRIERKGGEWMAGGRKLSGRAIELRPATSPGLWVNDRFYRGSLRLVPFDNRRFWVVNVLPFEHYLCSVIDGEIPGQFHNEARKAQTVAARTYALRRREQNAAREFDVYASPTRDQNYHGFQYRDGKGRAFAGESAKSRQAVRETLGKVLRRNGKLARTYYSACCGGVTSTGTTTFPDATDMPSVVCGHCQECPRYRWSTRLTASEISAGMRKGLGKKAPATFEVHAAEVAHSEDRTRLPELIVRDKAGQSLTLDTRSFRSGLPRTDLFSVWFSVEKEGDRWRLDGIGHGHGVGLCQWGANGFGKAGKAFDEILRHYYPGADVVDGGA
ncbi:Amidase enhancer precursor [Caulifigura coniformis]|uniref:Amidase enhancer n=1 Tax=Caulifigura coniformis TaxID=2527983 RepID=A0A517SEN7_9PLAN|nr:SpoIID/LytB domain-containing protein [Caulifigura coniformis]QDT54581.1 Amidase enhancer precursor [Caulifigura coniformis]